MKKIKFNPITIIEKEKSGQSDSMLLFLISGVFGLLLFVHSIHNTYFSLWLVLPAAAIFCIILKHCYLHSSKRFLIAVLISVAGGGIAAASLHRTLYMQIRHIIQMLEGESDLPPMDITMLSIFMIIVISLVLFICEYIIKGHIVVYVVLTLIMLLSPLVGIRITIPCLLFLFLFQTLFWIQHLSRISIGRKTSIAVSTLLVFVFMLTSILGYIYSQQLYNLTYEAEGFVHRTLNNISGKSVTLNSGGDISRGNNHKTGEDHLELRMRNQPTEDIYLKGFSGDEYTRGEWREADEKEAFKSISDNMGWQRSPWIEELYYSIPFNINSVLNWGMDAEQINIKHCNGNYERIYSPYNSMYESNGYISYQDESANKEIDGYGFSYYEQKDMNIISETTDTSSNIYITESTGESERTDMQEGVEAMLAWYNAFREEYRTYAEGEYTKVPAEQLPRLTELVKSNPLIDLDEITAFILYTLHSNASYSLTPGWSKLNEDVIEQFLFETGKGYCVHFASAAALMYRLYGIPARYVSGYKVPASAFEPTKYGSLRVDVTDENEHAWVEILLPEYGWTPIEVTPSAEGGTNASYPGFGDTEFNNLLDDNNWNMNIPSLVPDNTNDTEEIQAENQSVGEIDFDKYSEVLFALSICVIYVILLTPVLLVFRRIKKLNEIEGMNSRRIYTCLIELLHFCGYLVEYNGSESDFAEKLSELISSVSKEEVLYLVSVVKASAYGSEEETLDDSKYAVNLYRLMAKHLYSSLPMRKKIIAKYIRAYV